MVLIREMHRELEKPESSELIVALDGMDNCQAERLIELLGDRVAHYKIGLELFTRYGPSFVKKVQEMERRVFLDVKYHDIPATVGRAVSAAVDLGIFMVNVHAAGGASMIEAAARANASGDTKLIAVTVLTSRGGGGVEEEVMRFAELARSSGADGVVAAVSEVEAIKRKCGGRFLTVTPGIRPAGAEHHDQVRVATPAEAVAAGSDYLVVGRAITGADDPLAAAETVLREMDHE